MRIDLIWRAVLPLAVLVALLAGAPRTVCGLLALASLALAADAIVRLRGTGPADRALVGVGGVVVVLVLSGLLLDVLGIGLRPASWTVTLAVLSAVGLLVAALLPARGSTYGAEARRADRRVLLRTLPWVAAAALVTVLAVRLSTASLSAADAPPLQMSLGRVSGTQVQVTVSTTDAVGPLELRTSADGNDISYPLFSLGHDGSRTTTVALPTSGRFTITVGYPDQDQPLRTLVLDR